MGVFLSASTQMCASVGASKAWRRGCCDLPAPGSCTAKAATPGRMSKLKRKRGMNVAANHVFIGNSISPTYGAGLCPDAGLLSRAVNCVSKLEKQAEDVFYNGGPS